jgi:hypothetical protein
MKLLALELLMMGADDPNMTAEIAARWQLALADAGLVPDATRSAPGLRSRLVELQRSLRGSGDVRAGG